MNILKMLSYFYIFFGWVGEGVEGCERVGLTTDDQLLHALVVVKVAIRTKVLRVAVLIVSPAMFSTDTVSLTDICA